MMQKQTILLTPSYNSAENQTFESSKLSRASMTSQQRKLHQFGMYFPQKVIFTTKLDIKSPKEEWDENVPIRLTSQAFGHIPISTIDKIKYYTSGEDKLTLKVMTQFQNAFFQVEKSKAVKIFSLIAWGKLATMNIFSDSESNFQEEISGVILKKSEILGNWEERYVRISAKEGLASSKNQETAPSLKIPQTTEVWTRFQTINQDSHIVVKLWYGFIKQEFAVPTHAAVQWLQALCSLLAERT